MSVIFSLPSWSKEMRSCTCCMRKSKFRNRRWRKERFTISRRWTKSGSCEAKLRTASASWSMLKRKLSASRISSARYTFLSKNYLSKNKRRSSFPTSLRSPSMFTGGESWNQQILRLTSWFKRFKVFRSVWSRRLKKSQRRTYSFRRRKNYTLS